MWSLLQSSYTCLVSKSNLSLLQSSGAFQMALVVKNPPANAGVVRNAGSGRSPGGGNSNLLQYSCWKITWTKEPGRPQSIGLHRIGHEWSDLVCTHLYLHSSFRLLTLINFLWLKFSQIIFLVSRLKLFLELFIWGIVFFLSLIRFNYDILVVISCCLEIFLSLLFICEKYLFYGLCSLIPVFEIFSVISWSCWFASLSNSRFKDPRASPEVQLELQNDLLLIYPAGCREGLLIVFLL